MIEKYIRKENTPIVAVQVNLDTYGFTYNKWGGIQHCKKGDWIVLNKDDTYTIDQESFAKTYTQISLGLYEKSNCVWAMESDSAGVISTKEGLTDYFPGDYLVSNNEDGSDCYAMKAKTFHRLYTRAN